jgi:hypothetical protein
MGQLITFDGAEKVFRDFLVNLGLGEPIVKHSLGFRDVYVPQMRLLARNNTFSGGNNIAAAMVIALDPDLNFFPSRVLADIANEIMKKREVFVSSNKISGYLIGGELPDKVCFPYSGSAYFMQKFVPSGNRELGQVIRSVYDAGQDFLKVVEREKEFLLEFLKSIP